MWYYISNYVYFFALYIDTAPHETNKTEIRKVSDEMSSSEVNVNYIGTVVPLNTQRDTESCCYLAAAIFS